MNRIERLVRNMINPYSTAFASWWCHSCRYWRLPRKITGNMAVTRPGLPRPAVHYIYSYAPGQPSKLTDLLARPGETTRDTKDGSGLAVLVSKTPQCAGDN